MHLEEEVISVTKALDDAKREMEGMQSPRSWDALVQLKATVLYKDLATTALIEEVASVKGKYKTLASDHANFVANSRDAFATLSIVALSAKEQVVTVRGKYETLASDYANVKRELGHPHIDSQPPLTRSQGETSDDFNSVGS